MKVTYTDDAIADILDAITCLFERNPAAAASNRSPWPTFYFDYRFQPRMWQFRGIQ